MGREFKLYTTWQMQTSAKQSRKSAKTSGSYRGGKFYLAAR
jgi:hypothetical protein